MRTSEETNEIIPALLEVNKELKNPPATTENPFYKSKYTPLDYLIEHIKEQLVKHDLFIIQSGQLHGNDTVVITRLCHVSGQWVETETGVPSGADAQKTGGSITYARRYALSAMFNIASDPDNDANETVDKLSEMPQDVRQLFIDKGYKTRQAVQECCEACNYDWKLIKKNLEV